MPRKRRRNAPESGGKCRPREYHQHGLTALKGALARFEGPGDWTEALGPVCAALRVWREELLGALGGVDVASPQRRSLVEVATRTHLMLESVDRFILGMPCLVNKSKRSIFAVVKERQHLADSLARYLGQLGLDRVPGPALSFEAELREILAERQDESSRQAAQQQPEEQEPGDPEEPAGA